MNRKHVFAAAVIALASSAAFAQMEVELQHFGATQSEARTTTRAAVAAVSPKAAAAKASGLTRADVRAEVLKAQADGSLARPADLAVLDNYPVASVRTREEVRAEAIAATKTGKAARVQVGH